MSTSHRSRSTGETWRAWLPPGAPDPPDEQLMTRAAFVAALQARLPAFTESTLLAWQRAGTMPRPIRRPFRGAIQALYPRWLLALAVTIPTLHEEGVALPEIGARLRDAAGAQLAATTEAATGEPNVIYRAAEPDAFAALLATAAARFEALTGRPALRLELIVTDGDGDRDTFAYPA
jgi:hypothetical protein